MPGLWQANVEFPFLRDKVELPKITQNQPHSQQGSVPFLTDCSEDLDVTHGAYGVWLQSTGTFLKLFPFKENICEEYTGKGQLRYSYQAPARHSGF
jgi:hypothetical protein